MKYTIQNYSKKMEPCDVTVDHSLVVSQMENDHISLYIVIMKVKYNFFL